MKISYCGGPEEGLPCSPCREGPVVQLLGLQKASAASSFRDGLSYRAPSPKAMSYPGYHIPGLRQGYKGRAIWPRGTALMGHVIPRASCGVGCSCQVCTAARFLPLPNPASSPPPTDVLPKHSLINILVSVLESAS